jgi:hypothetical protein
VIDAPIFLLSFAGFALLLLAMPRHQRDWLGRRLPPSGDRILRATGFVLLALAFAVAEIGLGYGYGVVAWFGWLTIAAALVVAVNINRARIHRKGSAMMRLGDPARARWAVAVRVLAGTLGAYGLAALVTVALSLALAALGMNRVEAVHAATLASFAIFAVIAMVVFHARNLTRTWAWLAVGSVLLALAWQLPAGILP